MLSLILQGGPLSSRKTPPFAEYEAWTTSKFFSFIRSGLRAKFSRWPPKYECLADAKRIVSGKRHKYEFKCAQCKKWKKQKEVQIDHIVPCGTLKTYTDLPGFVERLFVGKEKLRVLCIACHKGITNESKRCSKET